MKLEPSPKIQERILSIVLSPQKKIFLPIWASEKCIQYLQQFLVYPQLKAKQLYPIE